MLEAAHALPTRPAKGVAFDSAIPSPDAEHEVAAPDRVERGDALGHFHRVVQRRQQYARNARHLPRFCGEARQEWDQLDLTHPFAEVMLAGRDGIPPAVARESRHRILAFQ